MMALFRYKAQDAAGTLQQGVIEADSDKQARYVLRQRQWQVLSIKSHRRFRLLSAHLGLSEQALFARQLSILLHAGMSVERALSSLIDQEISVRLTDATSSLKQAIVEGLSLSEAFLKIACFEPMFVALARAGERSGQLAHVFGSLASYLENRQTTTQKIMGALIYPVVVFLVAVIVIVVLMSYVMPQLIHVFEHAHYQLPLLTRIFVGLSHGIHHYGTFVLLCFILACVGAVYAYHRSLSVRRWAQIKLLSFPFIGKTLMHFEGARFAATLSILLSGGTAFIEAMTMSARIVSFSIIRDDLMEVCDRVRTGAHFSAAMKEKARYFPVVLIHFIDSGDSAGQLPYTLEKCSEMLLAQAQKRLLVFVNLLEPAMIIMIGIFVLLIVMATLVPILRMNTLVH